MTEQPSAADAPSFSDETEEVLQAAVWMCQDLAVDLPPIPDSYAQDLREFKVGRLYATDATLLELATPESLADAIASDGWPRRGLSFGYRLRGRLAHWFYTLVGDQRILHLSLPINMDDDLANSVSTGLINQAHAQLARYFATDTNYFRYVLAPPLPDSIPRTVVTFADEDFVAREMHAHWTAEGGLRPPEPRSDIFREGEATTEVISEEMIFRP